MRYPSGFLSGAASAHYQGMRRGIPDFYEFTVPEASCRPCGVQFALFHYSSFIPPSHIEDKLDGIRVSTPARAVFENASRLDAFALRSMIQAGLERKLFTREDLLEMGKEMRSPGRAGSKLYSHVVGVIPDEVPVDSEEELLLLEALRTAGLPEIVTQYPLKLANGGKAYLDLGVPSARLDVEVDGPEHDTVVAAHRDKSRDAQVAVVGWQTMRFPTKQVRNQLRIVTAQIVAATHSRMKLLGA